MVAFLHDLLLAATSISSVKRQFFMTLGEGIAALRRATSITQAQLVKALGVPRQKFVPRMTTMALSQATR